MKRVSAWLLLIVMIVPLFLFTGCSDASEEDTWKIPDFSELERREPNANKYIERGDVRYAFVEENDKYGLYINTDNYDIALVEKSSGEIWYSNPSKETIAASGNNSELYAQLQLTWLDKKKGSQSYYNSYDNAVIPNREEDKMIDQVIMTTGPDGAFRVLYLMGRIQKDYVIPRVLTEELYENMKAKYLENGGNPFSLPENFVKLSREIISGTDKKTGLNENIQATYYNIAPELRNLKVEDGVVYLLTREIGKTTIAPLVEKALSDCGMTPEWRKEIDEQWGVAELTNHAFVVPLDYKLEEDGLKVSIPLDEVTYNDAQYAINSMQVLRLFGAADTQESGYMVVPDGSGALINFNNGKIALSTGVSIQM